MKRFVEGEDRSQSTLFPERLDEYIAEDNPLRAIDAFVEELTWLAWDSNGSNLKSLAVLVTTLQHSLKSMSTAISTASNPVADCSERPSAMSR